MAALELQPVVFLEVYTTQKASLALFDAQTLCLLTHNSSFQKATLLKKVPARKPELGHTLTDFFFEVEEESILNLISMAKSNGEAFDQCRQMLKGANSYFPAEIKISSLENGQILRLECGSVAQILNLEKLKFQKEKLEATLGHMDEEMLVVDSELRFLDEMGKKSSRILECNKTNGTFLSQVLRGDNTQFLQGSAEDYLFHLSSLFMMPAQTAGALCQGSDQSFVWHGLRKSKMVRTRAVPIAEEGNVVRLALLLSATDILNPVKKVRVPFLLERNSIERCLWLQSFLNITLQGQESQCYESLALLASGFEPEALAFLSEIQNSQFENAANILNSRPSVPQTASLSQDELLKVTWTNLFRNLSASPPTGTGDFSSVKSWLDAYFSLAVLCCYRSAFEAALLHKQVPLPDWKPFWKDSRLCWPLSEWNPLEIATLVEETGFMTRSPGQICPSESLVFVQFVKGKSASPAESLATLRWMDHWKQFDTSHFQEKDGIVSFLLRGG